MREKLETLPLVQLRELAKSQGIKSVTILRKQELINKLCEVAEKMEQEQAEKEREERTAREKAEQERIERERAERAEQRGSQSDRAERNYQSDRTERNYQSDRTERNYQSDRTERNYQSDRSERNYQSDRSERNYQSDRTERNYQNDRTDRNYRDDRSERPMNQSQINAAAQAASDDPKNELKELDSGIEAKGILEVMPDGFGFIRCENFLPGENDVYVAPSQIRRFNMKTGDIIRGNRRVKTATEKFAALLYVTDINGYVPSIVERRPNFEDLTPIFPNRRLSLEVRNGRNTTAMRVMDLLAPIGKGQRGMIVSPPKAGKTTLLKQVAKAVTTNYPEMHLIILLIDERPEEVTDIKESVFGPNVEVIYSTFDELPERHKRVSEMVIERARRLVEHGRDVMILLDSITRLARAYNLVVPPSGRTLSGGLDPAALHMPKRFFGAARNMREGGSLTILATALVDTGSRMDDVIYEEFKGTGNMEVVLDRKLSEKRIFPAIDILKSGTRRDDLLLTADEAEAVDIIRKGTNSMKPDEAVEKIIELFSRTRTNREFTETIKKTRPF